MCVWFFLDSVDGEVSVTESCITWQNRIAFEAMLLVSKFPSTQATMLKLQQQCRSVIRLCRKNRSTCSIRQCCFDIVAIAWTGLNNVHCRRHTLPRRTVVNRCVRVDGIALGNTTESTFPFPQDLVRYSHLRRWRPTEVHKRGIQYTVFNASEIHNYCITRVF